MILLSHRLQNSCIGLLRKIYASFGTQIFLRYKKVSGYDQEIPQSHTTDQPTARDQELQNNNKHKTQASGNNRPKI